MKFQSSDFPEVEKSGHKFAIIACAHLLTRLEHKILCFARLIALK